MKIGFGWKRPAGNAGLVTIDGDRGWLGWAVHLGVMRSAWEWGYNKDQAFGVWSFGLGPLLLVCWS